MATQTGSYDFKAAKAAHDEASKKASDYITDITNDGIMVHAEGEGPDDTQTPTGWHISNVLEFIREGVSRFWIGLKNQGDTTPTVRIGKAYNSRASDNESHMELDYHSLQLIDKNGSTYLHVSDFRKANGIAEIDDRFIGDGYTEQFELSTPISRVLDPEFSLTVDGSQPGFNYEISYDASIGLAIIYNTSTSSAYVPSIGAVIVISYKTDSELAKAYTFGTREGNIGAFSIAEGLNTTASGMYSHAEGAYTVARGYISHAEGDGAEAGGAYSHAQGYASKAAGYCSNAEGEGSIAQGIAAHSEGQSTAIGDYSHSEGAGYDSESAPSAEGYSSHAEGVASVAGGMAAHAEGYPTEPEYTPGSITVVGTPCTASGLASHAEGRGATADGEASHAQNLGTIASSDFQTALGKYNVDDANDTYAAIIGNGTADNARSDALRVDWSGNVLIDGDVQDLSGTQLYADASHSHSAADIASGTLDAARIPSLDASKIGSGTLNLARIPTGTGASQVALGNHTHNYVPLSGGTMTGSLNINTANLNIYDGQYYKKSTAAGYDRDGAAPSSDVWAGLAQLNDKDGNPFVSLTSVARSSTNGGWKDVGLYVYSHDGTNQIQNNLIMGIKPDGSKRVSLYSEPWRTALGILRYGRLAGQSSNITLTTSAQKIPFNSFGGSGCSASSNGIKVTGAGTYMIWASAYMTTGYTDNDIIHFIIYKNSTAMYEHQERTTNASPYKTVQIGPTFFDLAANDVVYLYAYNQASARGVIYSKSMTGLYLRQIA